MSSTAAEIWCSFNGLDRIRDSSRTHGMSARTLSALRRSPALPAARPQRPVRWSPASCEASTARPLSVSEKGTFGEQASSTVKSVRNRRSSPCDLERHRRRSKLWTSPSRSMMLHHTPPVGEPSPALKLLESDGHPRSGRSNHHAEELVGEGNLIGCPSGREPSIASGPAAPRFCGGRWPAPSASSKSGNC